MIKKLLLLLFTLFSFAGFTQVQRTPIKKTFDSTALQSRPGDASTNSRREIFKELDLTREQKIKLKAINQAMKASKDGIDNDASLSDADKKNKLKALRKENALKIQAILTEQQKAKFKKLRENNMND